MERNELLNARLDGIVRPHKGSCKIDATGTGKDDPAYNVNIKIDWTGWTVQQALDLAARTLWISRQRVLRGMTPAEVEGENGRTINASAMGKKPESIQDMKASLMAAGMPEAVAEIAVTNPALFAQIMSKVTVPVETQE